MAKLAQQPPQKKGPVMYYFIFLPQKIRKKNHLQQIQTEKKTNSQNFDLLICVKNVLLTFL